MALPDAETRYVATNALLFVLALGHALATWRFDAVVALFGGGVAVAFVLEALAIRFGLLAHHHGSQVLGVPLHVLVAWPAVVYAFVRLSGVVLPVVGVPATAVPTAALAAVLATAADALVDPLGVEEGAWSYPDAPVSDPRLRGVPWWNFLAWLVVVFVTAMLPTVA